MQVIIYCSAIFGNIVIKLHQLLKYIFQISIILSLLLILFSGAGIPISKRVEKTHEISIPHPGKEGMVPNLQLIEVEGAKASHFYMDVISVYCSDSVCKIDTVRLFWNAWGKYMRYQLPSSIELEKAEGKPFLDDDYAKLQKILSDTQSPFSNLAIDDIIQRNDIDHGMEVDAYTGATVIELNPEETVEGAALTCFTLWHWANGNAQTHIRNITGNKLSTTDLVSLLNNKAIHTKNFALEQVLRKKLQDDHVTTAIIEQITKDESKYWIDLRIQFIESLPEKTYLSSLLTLIEKAKKHERIQLLQSINNYELEVDESFLEALSPLTKDFETYREIDLFLNLIEKHEVKSNKVIQDIFSLLSKDILVARRAYWFLDYQESIYTRKQKKKIKKFYKKNQDYL